MEAKSLEEILKPYLPPEGETTGGENQSPEAVPTLPRKTLSRFLRTVRVHNPYLSEDEGKRRMETAGFFPRYTEGTWEYLPEMVRSVVRKSLREEFLGDVSREPRGFFIYGRIGVGKSMLLGLMAQSVLRQFAATVRFVSSGMLEELFFQFDDKKKQQVQELKMCDALFLDDLGVEYGSDFSMTAFTNLFEYRYAHYKPTFVTCNYTIAELSEIDGYARIASRLNQENWMLHLSYKGPDKRVRGEQKL